MISKATEKAIEDAVSEAASDDKKNPTSRYNTQKGRNNTAKYGRKAKKMPSTPKIASDPSTPGKMGGNKTLQMPYKRKISKALGTSELPVGKPVRDGMKPVTGSKGTSENMTKKFAMGGEVRPGDVPDNSKRAKCYQ